MNIKITVDNVSENIVNATMYLSDTNTNVGTLWMTTKEFDQFVGTLTFGMDDDSTLEVIHEQDEYWRSWIRISK